MEASYQDEVHDECENTKRESHELDVVAEARRQVGAVGAITAPTAPVSSGFVTLNGAQFFDVPIGRRW